MGPGRQLFARSQPCLLLFRRRSRGISSDNVVELQIAVLDESLVVDVVQVLGWQLLAGEVFQEVQRRSARNVFLLFWFAAVARAPVYTAAQ